MQTFRATITRRPNGWTLRTIYNDAARQTEGYSGHATVEDAIAYLEELAARLGATITEVEVVREVAV